MEIKCIDLSYFKIKALIFFSDNSREKSVNLNPIYH